MYCECIYNLIFKDHPASYTNNEIFKFLLINNLLMPIIDEDNSISVNIYKTRPQIKINNQYMMKYKS